MSIITNRSFGKSIFKNVSKAGLILPFKVVFCHFSNIMCF